MNREPKRRTVLEVGDDGVALITIVNPPVNALTADVFRSLSESYEQAMGREDVKAVVVTGAKGIFCGGFDVNGFGGQKRREEQTKPGHTSVDFFTDAVEAAKKPSVAAIDGVALGGGLELTMACHARISTPTARLGLTELQFGVIPGLGGIEQGIKAVTEEAMGSGSVYPKPGVWIDVFWITRIPSDNMKVPEERRLMHFLSGGVIMTSFRTQRLPRLVGLSKSLEMMLTSKAVEGTEACSLGLVDAVISPNELLPTARKWALDISQYRRPWVASLYRTDRLGSLEETKQILNFARSQVKNQALNVKHLLICIDVVEEGIISDPWAGLWKEAKESQQLQKSYTTKCLVHLFFAQRGALKVPGVTDRGLMPRQVNKIAILGGGLMGSGIATALILNNYSVILKEVNEKYLHAGIRRVKANLESHVKKGKMTEEKLERTMSLLSGVLDYESFRNVDLVIEAVIEDVSLKQQIFAELEKYCPPYCILASNTSTIDLTIIGERTRSLDRIVGAHFFSPVHTMPLLEIVRTRHTSPQVVVDLLSVGKKMKTIPVVVGNCTGFAVNRMFFPYTQAAFLLVERGTNPYRIDNAITKFGMPMGPFRSADLVGFGVAIATGMQFMENFPERTYKSMLIPILQEDKRAGESTSKGFYHYDQRRKATPDPDLEKYIEKARSISGVAVDNKLVNIAEEDIVEMIFFPVINEACRILAEGMAVKAADLDIAAVMGMGFPPYRGGVLFWADSLGSKHICSRLDEWSKMYGGFFKPCSYLAERAAKGITLSSLADQANSRL